MMDSDLGPALPGELRQHPFTVRLCADDDVLVLGRSAPKVIEEPLQLVTVLSNRRRLEFLEQVFVSGIYLARQQF